MISVSCQCGRRFTARDHLAGKCVKCPACSQPLDIPDPASVDASSFAASSFAGASARIIACVCGRKLKAPVEFAGKKVCCSACNHSIYVPREAASAIETASPDEGTTDCQLTDDELIIVPDATPPPLEFAADRPSSLDDLLNDALVVSPGPPDLSLAFKSQPPRRRRGGLWIGLGAAAMTLLMMCAGALYGIVQVATNVEPASHPRRPVAVRFSRPPAAYELRREHDTALRAHHQTRLTSERVLQARRPVARLQREERRPLHLHTAPPISRPAGPRTGAVVVFQMLSYQGGSDKTSAVRHSLIGVDWANPYVFTIENRTDGSGRIIIPVYGHAVNTGPVKARLQSQGFRIGSSSYLPRGLNGS